jgi:hypothetical protein
MMCMYSYGWLHDCDGSTVRNEAEGVAVVTLH